MFQQRKARIISAFVCAAIIWAIAVSVMGVSPAPVTIKLTPIMVSVDTTALSPKLAQAEMNFAWRLFDRDTAAAYMPMQTARVTVSLSEARTLRGIRVYGSPSYQINVYRDNAGNWEPVPSLSGKDLTTLGISWNSLTPAEPLAAQHLLLEFVPLGNITSGIAEIELWGEDGSTEQDNAPHITLEGIRSPQEALGILAGNHSHILEFSAAPTELSVAEGSTPAVTIGMTQNPYLFKRAYILYDGYNLVRPVSIKRRINGLSWAGGFAIPQPESTKPAWSSYIEEINPLWLVQGENRIEFQTTGGTAIIRALKLIVETDSGWNSVSSVSYKAAYDGDTTTFYKIAASSSDQSLDITFERTVQPETLKLHLSSAMNLRAGLQYLVGTAWQDVAPGFQIDFSTMHSGWNEITMPAAVTTDALRLVLKTAGLRVKPGVQLGMIEEVGVCASVTGSPSKSPRVIISYPRDGEYFGRTAYIQGFVTPISIGTDFAQINIEGKTLSNTDGSFSVSLAKDETHFSVQPDDESWDPVVKTEYAGQAGASIVLYLNKNSGATQSTEPQSENRSNAPFADNREKFTDRVTPGQAKKIQYKGVTLDIPEGAVDRDTDITIIPLTEPDLARLDPGMVNVTFPDAGYRFLPHGMKFLKPIKVSFGYSKQLFAAGQVDDEVNMYYYDEKFLRWQKLNRMKVDAALSIVESQSDHFTDIINSTLVVPEHPQALSFNPNSIKDIKAADPSASVNLIEPPKANSKGTANLSYPIEVPPGRNKVQPNIAVQYNSSGGNGWMGVGWDLPAQSITIDTRWGVPRYDSTYDETPDSNKETETYLLDGEQLTPLAHRGQLQPRTSEKVFHARVEGQFRKIIRHGTQPNNYWWEVTDKNGTRYVYGGTLAAGPDASSILTDDDLDIYRWALREVRDANNNYMTYDYDLVTDTGVDAGTVAGRQLYLRRITYTGHGTTPGRYTVTFYRDNEVVIPGRSYVRRSDVIIDARGGFKQVTALLLKRIEVKFDATLIRRYDFEYHEGVFHKTLLQSVSQFGAKGTLFNTHNFAYYDDISDGPVYNGFSGSTTWDTRTDGLDVNYLGVSAGPSAISGSEGEGFGSSFSVGFAPPPTKYLSFNGMVGSGMSTSEGTLQLVDIDGDGLSDKVFRKGNTIFYDRNTVTPGSLPSQHITFAEPQEAANMGALSQDQTMNFNGGGQAYIFGLNLILDLATNFTMQPTYISDVNGDGLIDVVSNGTVLFNRWKDKTRGDHTPEFSSTSAGTEFPIGGGKVDPTGMLPEDTFASIENDLMEENPLMDVVRRWKAPYSGRIAIDGDVQLIDVMNDPNASEDEKKDREKYEKADGVRVGIERPGLSAALWQQDIEHDFFSSITPTNTDSLTVNKDDVIYFRVQSQFDGAYDEVNWAPRVSYLETTEGGAAPVDTRDGNNLDPYVFKADQDFDYAGRVSPMELPFKGRVRLIGQLHKTDATSDNVRISVYKFSDDEYQSQFRDARRVFTLIHTRREPIARYSLRWDQIGDIDLSNTPDIDVQAKDKLFIIVEVDSNIDLTKLNWEQDNPNNRLQIFYTEAYRTTDQPEDEDGNPIKDKDGNTVGWDPGSSMPVQDEDGNYVIQIFPMQEMNFYPDNDLNQAQQALIANQTGWLMVNPQVTPKPVPIDDIFGVTFWKNLFQHDTELSFTVKQRGELAGKRTLSFSALSEYETHQQSFAVPVYNGDKLFFDFSTRDTELYNTLESTGVSVHYIKPSYTTTLNSVPVNKPTVAEWTIAAGTKTVLPILTAKAGSDPISGTVVLNVSYISEDEYGVSISANVFNRRIDFDTQAAFNPYENAFDLPDYSYGTFAFSYSIENADLASAIETHAVTIAVQTAFAESQQQFSGLELFTGPTLTDTGKALLPVGGSAAKVAIAPVITKNSELVKNVSGNATLTVVRRFIVIDSEGKPQVQEQTIAQKPVALTGKRFNPGEYTFDVDAQANDTLVLYFTSDDSELAGLNLGWGLWTQIRRHTNGYAPTATPPSMLHRYGYWDLFANSYRGWAFAGYNSQGTYNDIDLKDQPIVQSRLALPSNEGSYEVPTDHDEARSKRVKDFTAYPAVPQLEKKRWFAGDDDWGVKAGRMQSSRMGLNNVHLPRADELKTEAPGVPGGGAGATAPPRMSIVELEETYGIGFIININHTETPGQGLLDFMDMNGDRFPDMVGGNSIQYTNMVGGLGDATGKVGSTGISYVRDSLSTADNIAPGGTVQQAVASAKGLFNPKDGVAQPRSKNSSFGLTGSLGSRDNDVKADYLDMNGDGLPDKVTDNGRVALNLGYEFAPEESWNVGVIDDSETTYINAGVSMSFNDGVKGYSGSYSLTQSLGNTRQKFVDMNGDGLPDLVLEGSGALLVAINTGNKFAPARVWTGGGSLGDNQSFSKNGGFAFNITIGPICIAACYIDLNPAVSKSENTARAESAIQDVNGDGYPDQISSTTEKSLTVALNTTGRSNLLKTVKRPLGGKLEIEYERVGNTYDMPQSQWVMSRVKTTDGMRNTYRNDYAYAGGYQDRYEREFYGFRTVTETYAPETINNPARKNIARQVIQTYYNSDYYRKGLLQTTVTKDMMKGYAGNVWSKVENIHDLLQVMDKTDPIPDTIFPGLSKTITNFFDGSSESETGRKSTYQAFLYNEHGDVKWFFDAGEEYPTSDPSDDVTATIEYYNDPAKYIIKSQEIKVYGSGNVNPLRWRWAGYDSAGNMTDVILHNTKGPESHWVMEYYPNGNLHTIKDPVLYKLEYFYDPLVETYVTKILDNFSEKADASYYSTASHNVLFGQPDWTQDLNHNYQVNLYDEFGRTVAVCSPYDVVAGDIPVCAGVASGTIGDTPDSNPKPTIAFKFTGPYLQGDDNDTDENSPKPAGAVTKNKAVSVKGSDAFIVRTITFGDGMKRIIQTSKDADVDNGEGNPQKGIIVSGVLKFDELGRVEQQGQPNFETATGENYVRYTGSLNPAYFAYDTLDRTIEVLAPDEKAVPNKLARTTTTYTFGEFNGHLYAMTTVVDPEGNLNGANHRGTKISYKDVDDRIMGVVEYNWIENTGITWVRLETNYNYDSLGQIATVVDNRGNVTSVEYDDLGHRTAITNPDTGRTVYNYDNNGNLIAKFTAKNDKITYKYDFNRLMAIDYNGKADYVTYTYGEMEEAYNRAARIKIVDDESGQEVRYYGKLGEMTREEKTVLAHTPAVQKKKFSSDYVFDSFGRMVDMTYPDGEKLHYAYDNGGLLKAAWGEKSGNRYNYINSLLYNKFGQRTRITYGNRTWSKYTYNELNRRLATLDTTLSNGQQIQKLSYNYDLVGNIKSLTNGIGVPTNTALPAGPVIQEYEYDDLYQIVDAQGTYTFGPGKENKYHNRFMYDTIGNFTKKKLENKIIQPSKTEILPKETNYVLNYNYMTNHSTKPHAVTETDDKNYTYDADGNMTGWTSKLNGTRRVITWDEEDRVKEIDDNGKATYFLYNDAGERVVKRGQHGETIYVNNFFSIRSGELGTKHVYAGETRVLSKLVKTPPTNTANSATTATSTTSNVTSVTTTTTPGINGLDNGRGKKLGIIKRLPDGYVTGVSQPVEKDEFYYHTDHLGSSNMITDAYGAVYQHLEYFPYGETWIEEGGYYGGNTPGYKFTGKELDPETGLYYYGARYYDAVLSKWISADPALPEYLPIGTQLSPEEALNASSLKGGGVFKSQNLNMYQYAGLNPLKYIDPNGMWVDNGDGSFVAEKGDTLWGLQQETGKDWKRSDFKGDPTKLQIGQKVDLASKNTNQSNIIIDSNAEAKAHYYGGNGEPANLGPRTQSLLRNDSEQLRREGRIRNGVTTSLSGDYGVNMTLSMFHVGNTRVDYSSTCGSKYCLTDFSGFTQDGVWDITGFNNDRMGPGGEMRGGHPYPYIPYNWTISYPNPYKKAN